MGIIIIFIGLTFDFFGCLGLIRFPDIYNRLQAATKGVTLGTCGILVGLCFLSHSLPFAIKSIICAVFIISTCPAATHALVRGAYIFGIKLWDKSIIDKYKEDNPNN
ncbi:MAG: monovalent cation/H(+) antiporter subunit G [bacterium]|nr:monovalent cation/H(+) antiporter subunit G [bacterium]